MIGRDTYLDGLLGHEETRRSAHLACSRSLESERRQSCRNVGLKRLGRDVGVTPEPYRLSSISRTGDTYFSDC
jgi:hypothetical protein